MLLIIAVLVVQRQFSALVTKVILVAALAVILIPTMVIRVLLPHSFLQKIQKRTIGPLLILVIM